MISKLKPFQFLKILKQYRKIIRVTLTDTRIPSILRIMLIGTIIYIASPLDFLPDMIPLIGQIDDIWLVLVVLNYIKSNIPPQVMDEIDGKVIKGN